MAKTRKESQSDILREARERFDRARDADRVNREEARDDLRFRAGEQWPESIKADRRNSDRPMITINRTPQFVRQVTGDVRLNKPGIKVRPVDDREDPKKAEIFTGLIRNIESVSNAHIAYTTAEDAAATCGIGQFRIVTEFSEDDPFRLDIAIKRIQNPFAVVWDPDATEITKEDAKYLFFTDSMSHEAFKAKFPKADLSSFDTDDIPEHLTSWMTNDEIVVAEYWRKVPIEKEFVLLADGAVRDVTELDEADIQAMQPVDRKTMASHKVEWMILNGDQVLDGPETWDGRFLPFVPVVGEEVHVGDRVVRHGLVRFLKDPNRLYNYWRTTQVETIALQPKAPYVLTPSQINGHENMWADANARNYPYLIYNPDPQSPGAPKREMPPVMSQGMTQEIALAADDMQAVTGIYNAQLGGRSNETSGKAILARERQGDVGTYVYASNLALAIQHAGRILVDLIPHIFDTERAVRLLGEDDSETFETINQLLRDETTGEIKVVNDLSVGKYDVTVTTGPSFNTKRMESASAMMQFVQAAPQTAGLVMDLIAKNMDWPGADEFAKRFRKALPPGIAEPNPDEPPPQPKPPSIPEQLQMMKIAAETGKAKAMSEKMQQETETAKLENLQKELEISASTGGLEEMVRAAVRQTLARVLLEGQQPEQQTVQPSPIPGNGNIGGQSSDA